jgi:hypothetical protein
MFLYALSSKNNCLFCCNKGAESLKVCNLYLSGIDIWALMRYLVCYDGLLCSTFLELLVLSEL